MDFYYITQAIKEILSRIKNQADNIRFLRQVGKIRFIKEKIQTHMYDTFI